ncbi:NlpC/P60 family protein [Pedobacter polaris]|uniref:NlpC/P60 family protein n=1 Tax=Pedobacter polaris TaxID=2571273 RepID=A0A4U1CMG9_9SPHI|nr:C40 family peptidase [Pedobacter polaris]TKC08289.1 NlpC/P60 family protein [Pedobacter polaris]
MRNLYLTLILTVCVFIANAQSDTSAYRMQATNIQKKFAPDKRAIYFNMQIRGDSVKLESTSQEVLSEFDKVKPTMANVKFTATLLPAKSLNGLEYGVSNLSVSNNRANPQNAAELMTQMLLGTPIRILKKQGGFYLVKTPDGYLSWTDGSAIKPMNKDAYEAWQKSEKVVFTADYGHSFTSPKIDGMRVSDLVNGNILQLLAWGRAFSKVGYPDGRVAYVQTSQLKLYKDWIKRVNPNANAILKTAQTLLGVPYLWGGTSIKGVDCSGFTKTAYFLNGIVIPRDASQQALIGTAIDVLENDSISVTKCLKNLLPGDLLFFSAAKRRGINGGRVSHTAIYMGNGEFIQSAGMVKISSMIATAPNYDSGQSTTLVGARRILTEIGKPEITRIEQHDWYGKN